MRNTNKKTLLSVMAVAVICTLLGACIGMNTKASASAESTTLTPYVSPYTAAIAMVKDSVVGINNYQTVRYSNNGGFGGGWNFGFGNWGSGFGNGYGNSYEEQEVLYGSGSGVVVADGGYVLTNYHVVEGSARLTITVMPEGSTEAKEYEATLLAYDENLDIAVVQAKDLAALPVTFGDSDSLQVGDMIFCIGNPLSDTFSGTVTAGIVSALNRSISTSSTDKYGRKETTTNTMIQIDASINNGNSGGGMFDTAGRLMGIPTLKYSGSAFSGATIEGIGLCIPINAAKPLIESVLSGSYASNASSSSSESAAANSTMIGKPRMGVSITDMNSSSEAVFSGKLPKGVYVVSVDANSPAEAAGMQAGDIIVDVNDTVITTYSQIQSMISGMNSGDTLNVKVYRVPGITDLDGNDEIPDGKYVDLQVTLSVVDTVAQ